MRYARVDSNNIVRLIQKHRELKDGEMVDEAPTDDYHAVKPAALPDGWRDKIKDKRLKMPDPSDPTSITIERK